MTSAQSWTRRHHWLSWAGVIPIDFQRVIYLVIQNTSTCLSCKLKEGYEQYLYKNPSRNRHIYLAKSSLFVCYDWWRRLQQTSSVSPVCLRQHDAFHTFSWATRWIIHKQRVTPQDYALCREQRAVHGELWQGWPGRSLTTRCLRHTTRCELHNALHMECNALLILSNALHKISNALSSLITRYLMNQWIPSISVTWTTKCYLIGQYTYALLLLRNA